MAGRRLRSPSDPRDSRRRRTALSCTRESPCSDPPERALYHRAEGLTSGGPARNPVPPENHLGGPEDGARRARIPFGGAGVIVSAPGGGPCAQESARVEPGF